ncbi:MAG: isoprenyl transferase [Candidatus Omnitrophota bacterium]
MHVAIIMDGNGRWAKKRGLPRIFGHKAGADRIDEIVRACPDLGVKSLTLFAFSTENWKRPRPEVKFLMELMAEKIKSKIPQMQREGVRIRFLGDRSVFSKKMQNLMTESEAETAKGQKVNLSLGLNYGSQNEIVRAVRNVCQDVHEGKLQMSEITEDLFARYLDTREQPPPDLIIRTSGEQRISNFLLYQSAYAEFYFTQTFWPDFNAEEFAKTLEDFKQRQRRFGKL